MTDYRVIKTEPVFIDDPKTGGRRNIGSVIHLANNYKIFRKEVIRSKHLFNHFDGYAIQIEVYEKYKNLVEGIEIHETDTGDTYFATIDVWETKGRKGNWKHGSQKTLSCKHMIKGVEVK